MLQDQGKKLFNAAKTAKDTVEQKVTAALEVVVDMDKSLKVDLRTVRDKIKSEIGRVIDTLQVKTLDSFVKKDLGTLKQRIENLSATVDSKPQDNDLVREPLKTLEKQKSELDKITVKDVNKSIVSLTNGLESKFKEQIQTPLSQKVNDVDTAIKVLGGKFDQGSTLKTIDKIFEHIKDKVGEIKGKGGSGWKNEGGKGLLGIKSKVDFYFKAFSGPKFGHEIVKGWIEETILKHNGAVRKMLDKKFAYDDNSEKDVFTNVANEFKKQLMSDATAAGEKVVNGNKGAGGGTQKIHGYVNAVKQGCETFADALDGKLRNGNGFSKIFDAVKDKMQNNSFTPSKCICESVGCTKCNGRGNNHGTDCKEKAFLAAILCTLTAVSRQVGNELNSVFLSPEDANIASILDTITPIAKELDDKLNNATTTPPGQTESPAQAVDRTLQAVRDFSRRHHASSFSQSPYGDAH
ncbi:Extracellular matrix-binding ebh, putative [Babesia ovata]|uniref:Extracellular matrix-binding ebh, putative n=1 Tax=Babesia ovata TaxID=189622 RepID=A0A2H6KA97_9APIC|nr:Extracellular matrix-binding ebh, putative [Babesia ovata]GBE59916.1 Extracellular matrix-binding ebh, putative [Babesia ovata]